MNEERGTAIPESLDKPSRPRTDSSRSGAREVQTEIRSGGEPTWADPVARVAARVAHRFNNLLTVVHGNAAYLLDEMGDEYLEESLREIQRACREGEAVTSQLLSISGSQWGRSEVVDLRDFVSSLDLGILFSGEVTLCTDFPRKPCPVIADPSHLEEITRALVLNAREAVGSHGTVRLAIHHPDDLDGTGEPRGGWVRMEVSDSGPGMDSRTLDRALQPYFTTRSPDDDRGLGLSIAYGLVRQNGGELEISSSPGDGTTVQIWFPAG